MQVEVFAEKHTLAKPNSPQCILMPTPDSGKCYPNPVLISFIPTTVLNVD